MLALLGGSQKEKIKECKKPLKKSEHRLAGEEGLYSSFSAGIIYIYTHTLGFVI